ncbi:YqaA family protein [Bacillus sp. 2205SS5-2]|uniref:YqaA family protein n=1 Tax=Bacillus sp. 2205SS5-2 TaxID=3109031 RepID=UPI003006F85C
MSEMISAVETWFMNYGVWGLILLSFTESSFFPIPPDVLIIPMALANPDSALLYAFYTTLASALGSIFGWYIGKRLGRPVLQRFISEERILKVEEYFNKYGPLAILIAGFTPIPYKVFTVFAGVSKMKIRVLFLWSLVGRGIRFFLEAFLIIRLGEQALPFIEENLTTLSIGAAVLILFVYGGYRYFQKKQQTS